MSGLNELHAAAPHMSEERVRLRLTATVNYEPHGTPVSELQRLLRAAINHAHDNGLLGGDTHAEVGCYDVRVEELAPNPVTIKTTGPITGGPMAILSPYMDRYDELLSKTAEREGWDDEEVRAVICRYIAHVEQHLVSQAQLQRVEDFLESECRTGDSSLLAQARLAREVYAAVYEHVESFEEGCVGADLAYLLGAILRGNTGGCEWTSDIRPLIKVLRSCFSDGHAVWRYIHFDDADGLDDQSRLDRTRRTLGDVLDSSAFAALDETIQADVWSTL